MNELIKVGVNENQEPVVSARELHKGLGITDRFSRWFDRMLGYGFEENIDYIGCEKFHTLANQTLQDYILKIDMAKEIAMIQRNEKGKEIRKYFIQIEKDWNSPEKVMARALIMANNQLQIASEKIEVLEQKIEEDKPKVAFADRVLDTKDNVTITTLSKMISDEGYNISRNKLFEKLREWGYIFKKSRMPIQKYIEKGYFVVTVDVINTAYGLKEINNIKVTPKGQVHITEKILAEINI